MEIRCLLGHSYKRLTECVPVKYGGEFNDYAHDGHYALGKCSRCGKMAMVQCFGCWTYYPLDMLTKKEWFKKLVAEHEEADNG